MHELPPVSTHERRGTCKHMVHKHLQTQHCVRWSLDEAHLQVFKYSQLFVSLATAMIPIG